VFALISFLVERSVGRIVLAAESRSKGVRGREIFQKIFARQESQAGVHVRAPPTVVANWNRSPIEVGFALVESSCWKLACHLSVVKVICEREEPVCPDFFCTAGGKREVAADSSQPQVYSKGSTKRLYRPSQAK